MIVAIVEQFLFPRFMVAGDAAATAANIAAAETTYRAGIVLGLATHVIFILVVVALYVLLKEVNEGQALLMVLLVSVGVAVALSNMVYRFAPLVLLDGGAADYLSVFSMPQRQALALETLRLRGSGNAIPMAFWGLWLLPFGLLVARSGFLPRILGILLLVAGVAYLASSVTRIVFPDQASVIAPFLMPLYFGEVPIIFWLLMKGARPAPAVGTGR
jgi:hypothetical protein